MPQVDGSVVQRNFAAGELTPALWPRTDVQSHAMGLKTARNVVVQRQGGVSMRPGTVMIAPVKNSNQGRVRLLPFVFSNELSYVLEFGDKYMRVYRDGAQINVGPIVWSPTQPYVPGNLVSYNGVNYYALSDSTNVAPPSADWYALAGSIFEIPTPYAIADVPNIQFIQNRAILYIACGGNGGSNYPVQQLLCGGDAEWTLTAMTFTPATQAPGQGAGQTTPTFADPAGLYPWYGTTYGYYNYPNYESGNPGHWDNPWGEFAVGEVLVPGENGLPAAGQDGSGLPLDLNYYQITATDLSTGIESYPMPGVVSGWKCTQQKGIIILALSQPGTSATADVISRFNNANAQPIQEIVAGFPLIIQVADASTFTSGDLFTFSGTGNAQLDGKTFPGFVAANQVVFTNIDGSNFSTSVAAGATLTCLTSVVTSCPLEPAAALCLGGVEQVNNGGQEILGGTDVKLYTPTQGVFPDSGMQGWQNAGGAFDYLNVFNFLQKCFSVGPMALTWDAPSQAGTYVYNIYRKTPAGLWGLIETTSDTNFTDIGTVPNTALAPPDYTTIGAGQIGNPAVIGAFQQRLVLANTSSNEDWVYMSNTGDFNQFTTTQPTPVDSDTVQFEVASVSYNEITQIVDNAFLLIFTETGEFNCYGAGSAYSAGPITPTSVGMVQQGKFGANIQLPPITVGKNVLHVQTLQSKIRELLYTYMVNGYMSADLTVDSEHLFDGFTLVDWCYQQEPNSLVWAVRSDGTLLCLTYLPEFQIKGWTRHDTEGTFESVCAIPEGTEHALYTEVLRNGTRYIERFANQIVPLVPEQVYIASGALAGQVKTKMVPDWTKWCFMDCSQFYDGRQGQTEFSGATGLPAFTLAGGDYTANGNGFTLQAVPFGDNFPVEAEVGQAYLLTDPSDGSVYPCVVLEDIAGPTEYLVRPLVSIPLSFQGGTTNVFAVGINQVTGLNYLPNGTEVTVLADGAVLSSYATPSMYTVQNGSIGLPGFFGFIRVGLPYFGDVRSLDVDTVQQGQTAMDKPQLINRVAIYFKDTRGAWVGTKPPVDSDVLPLENMQEYEPRTTESLGRAPMTHTGIQIAPVDAEFTFGANVFVRQPNPLPMTILSLVPAGKYMLGG